MEYINVSLTHDELHNIMCGLAELRMSKFRLFSEKRGKCSPQALSQIRDRILAIDNILADLRVKKELLNSEGRIDY